MKRLRRVAILVAATLVLTLTAGALGRFGYAMLQEDRDLQLVDEAFATPDSLRVTYSGSKSPLWELGERSSFDDRFEEWERFKKSSKLGTKPPAYAGLVEHLAVVERFIIRFAARSSGVEQYREFREMQYYFLKSRGAYYPYAYVGRHEAFDPNYEPPPPPFSSKPSVRERAKRLCAALLQKGLWSDVVAAQCHNYIGIVETDTLRDNRQIADPQQALEEGLAAFRVAVELSRETREYRRNLELLLLFEEELLRQQEQGSSETGEDSEEEDSSTDPSEEKSGEGAGSGFTGGGY